MSRSKKLHSGVSFTEEGDGLIAVLPSLWEPVVYPNCLWYGTLGSAFIRGRKLTISSGDHVHEHDPGHDICVCGSVVEVVKGKMTRAANAYTFHHL